MPLIMISGSGRRLGRGLAIEFAKKGWDLAVHYNSSGEMAERTKSEIEALGSKCHLVKADVLNESEVNAAVAETVTGIGCPDVLINNAGIYPPKAPLSEISSEMWDEVMSVNLRGEFYFAKAFAAIAGENARIINIASLGGLEIWKERIPYNVSKAAVIQLTKALARELAPKISVNCICPGTIDIPGEKAVEEPNFPESRIPMQRYGTVSDVFDAAYFFATLLQIYYRPGFVSGRRFS